MTRRGDPQIVLDKAKAGFEGGLAAWIEGQTFLEVWQALFANLDEWQGDYNLQEGSDTFTFFRRYPHKLSLHQLEAQIAREHPEGGFFAARFMRATGDRLKPLGNTYLFEVKAAPKEEEGEEMARNDVAALTAQNAQLQEAIKKLQEEMQTARRAGDTANATAITAQVDVLMKYQSELQKEIADMRASERTRFLDVEEVRKAEYREMQDTARDLFKSAGDAIKESVAEMSNTTRFLLERLDRPQQQSANGGTSDLMQFFMSQQADITKNFQTMFERMDERNNARFEKMESWIKEITRPQYQPNPAAPPSVIAPPAAPIAPVDPMDVTLATLEKNKRLAELMGYGKAEIVEDKKSGLSEIAELLDKLKIGDLIHAKVLEKPDAARSGARPPKMNGVQPIQPPPTAPRYEIPTFAPPSPPQPPMQPPQPPPGYYPPPQPPQPQQPPMQPQQPPMQPQQPPMQPQQPPMQPQQPPPGYYPPPQPPQPPMQPQQPQQPPLTVVQLPDGTYAPQHLADVQQKNVVDSGDPDDASGAKEAIHILPDLEPYAGHLKPLLTRIFYEAPNAPPAKKLIASINPDPSFRSLLSQFPQQEITEKIAEMINDPVVRDPSRRAWLESVVSEYMNP